MSRNTQYQFVSTNTDEIINELIQNYEKLTKITVQPGSPEKLFILWVASAIVQERVRANHIGNQNIPSRATGENLDSLGEEMYNMKRPAAQAAVCTVRFYITQALPTSVLIPAGTRVTDVDRETVWQTKVDAYIEVGQTSTDIQVVCQKTGTVGNGYAVGQINTVIDLYDYCSHCENITASDTGADKAKDDEYYELMRMSMDGFSCAGPMGGYEYFAKRVSTEISDVRANTPAPCCVNIYAVMQDGSPASDEIKTAIAEACSVEHVRPMCDKVSVEDPEAVSFDIDFIYYIQHNVALSAAEIEEKVSEAVQKYITWQTVKLGRDILPDRLREYLNGFGIKRIELTSPIYTPLCDGKDGSVPQMARLGSVNVSCGGYEDE